jgi:hypothetical protein
LIPNDGFPIFGLLLDFLNVNAGRLVELLGLLGGFVALFD